MLVITTLLDMSLPPLERAQQLFHESFGGDPDGVWSAPGRVNLIGEHTDYNGGLALPIALPHRTHAAVRVRPDAVLRVVSDGMPGGPVTVPLADVGPGSPVGWAAYVAGVFWALREAGYAVPGADVAVASAVPVGAGLSSSAALECSVGAALSDLAGLGLLADVAGRRRLAAACQRAENDVAGAPTGGMDQVASVLGTAGHALLLDCRDGSTRAVPFDLSANGLALLVVDTRAPHALVDGQYAARRHTCQEAAAALGVSTLRELEIGELAQALSRLPDPVTRRRVRHVVTEIDRVSRFAAAVEAADWRTAGALMVASHESLRDDYEVSCRELDLVVDSALAAGALGARMTGGGFGGCAIALIEASAAGEVERTVVAAFRGAGVPDPVSFLATAAEGAGSNQ
jgi:galactokinase